MSAAAVPACGGGVSVSSEGSVATGGSSINLAFADLSGAGVDPALEPDVVVASGKRGEVDVLVRQDFVSWRVFANYFSGGETVQVAGGRVADAGALFVRNTDGEIALMPTQAGTSHRLGFPVSIYHFIRNMVPTDSSPPATGFAIGDLDGDGSVEAVVAAPGLGLVVLPGLAAAADPKISPEHPPTINGFKLATGAQPREVVVTDVDGDGRADVAALDGDTPTLRTFVTHSQKPLDIQPDKTVTLPAVGASLRATGCAATPLLVTLADGRIVTVSRAGKVEPILDAMVPAHHVASSGDALVVDSPRGLSLIDSCADGGALLGVDPIAAVALTPANAIKARELAVLQPDGNTVSLYQVR
jgi:hypothetical protein